MEVKEVSMYNDPEAGKVFSSKHLKNEMQCG
jgi:hypothetical protein